jgi:hypothetical protein
MAPAAGPDLPKARSSSPVFMFIHSRYNRSEFGMIDGSVAKTLRKPLL